jgi:hypothetical protein
MPIRLSTTVQKIFSLSNKANSLLLSEFYEYMKSNVEVSQLMYGIDGNPSDSESTVYRPYNRLILNSEGYSKQYPISFHNARIKDGCICYDIKSGSCKSGIKYLSLQRIK